MLINSPNISGSLTVTGNSVISGSLNVLGSINGAITGTATTASYVEFANVADKPALVSGSTQISFNGITDKPSLVSGSSQITYSGLTGIPSGIVSGSVQIKDFGIFATTGSNQFNGNQAITGSLTTTGTIVAQTLNVQQVTSSIVYSSGSNIFGNELSNTQQFTGSLQVSGSSHHISGSLNISSTEFVKLPVGTTAQRPDSPVIGMTRFNTDDNFLEFYNGTNWELTSGQIPLEYVIVGGGGNGAGHTTGGSVAVASAPGGAGGYRSSVIGENTGGGLSAEKRFLININTSYSVSVGAAANNSNLGGIVALAGGAGRAGNGGSGGGGDFANNNGGTGTAGQGFVGGDSSVQNASGGGGGASAVGLNATSNNGGNGGNGVASSITGTSVTRAGGGGGSGATPGTGGTGGGAAGRSTTGNGNASPTANSGGGGGGAFSTSPGDYPGGVGASGVVIIRYPSILVVTVSAGLTASTSTVGSNKVTEFTAGSGTIMFSKV